MLLSLVLALLPLVPVQDGAPPLDRGAIEAAVDGSLHWLRGRQDLESGSYGGLTETLAALDAFTGSHRAYRMDDGPFVRKAVAFVLEHQAADGSIREEGASAERVQGWTSDAARILARLPRLEARAKRAAQFVGGRPDSSPVEEDAERASLIERAGATLEGRGRDGSWDGSVLETARRVVALNRIARALGALPAADEPGGPRTAAPPTATAPGPLDPKEVRALAREASERGAAFLLDAQVSPGKWGFSGFADPGITAMVVGGLLARSGDRSPEEQAAIEAALDWLASLQHEDGSIHAGQLANYVTSAAVMALARAGRERDEPVIERAMAFLTALQADEGEGYTPSDRFYGGVGYGGDERPDLSNLQMALEALHAGGVESGSPVYTKALKFLERCQNRSESNDIELTATDGTTIVSGNDGGAGYAPGDSKAGYIELSDGRRVARSYGSMTYALLKGYLFAGLPKDDPRVEAAWKWITSHYTLDVNPGFESSSDPNAPYQGLFYYYTTMARALALYGEDTVHDAAGNPHPWRLELASRLAALQRQDGTWRNQAAPRWYEGNPVLATAYALQTLGIALP